MKPLLLLLLSATPLLASNPRTTTLTPTEQTIVETAILQRDFPHSKIGVIDPTASCDSFRYDAKSSARFARNLRRDARDEPADVREAVADFIRKNGEKTSLVFPHPFSRRIQALTPEQAQQLSPDGLAPGDLLSDRLWKRFRRFHSHGDFVIIGRPGLDSKGSVAVLCVSQQDAA